MDNRDNTLDVTTVQAFGITCSTRYRRAEEMSQMLGFLSELNQLRDGKKLLAYIDELAYDSKADTLTMFVNQHWRIWSLVPPRPFMDAAMNHFPQWHFYGDDSIVISAKFEPDAIESQR